MPWPMRLGPPLDRDIEDTNPGMAKGKLAYFAAIDGVRFKRAAVPGDTVRTRVELIGGRRGIWRIRAESRVEGDLVCRGELTCALVDY